MSENDWIRLPKVIVFAEPNGSEKSTFRETRIVLYFNGMIQKKSPQLTFHKHSLKNIQTFLI